MALTITANASSGTMRFGTFSLPHPARPCELPMIVSQSTTVDKFGSESAYRCRDPKAMAGQYALAKERAVRTISRVGLKSRYELLGDAW